VSSVDVLISWFLLQYFHTFSKTWLIEFWACMEVCLDILCKSPQKTICNSSAYVSTHLWSSVISHALGYWTLQTYAFYCYFCVVFSGFLTCEQSNEILTGIEQRFSNKFFIFFDQKFVKVLFFSCVLLIFLFFSKSLPSFWYHKLGGEKKKKNWCRGGWFFSQAFH
jgi:hypothetical protein